MVNPTVTEPSLQVGNYNNGQLTGLDVVFEAEKPNAIIDNFTSDVTQDATTKVITVKVTFTLQSYFNGGRSNVSISRDPQPNLFDAPIPLLSIDQSVGLSIYVVSQTYAEFTTGDWTFTVEGDNVLFGTPITNPFD